MLFNVHQGYRKTMLCQYVGNPIAHSSRSDDCYLLHLGLKVIVLSVPHGAPDSETRVVRNTL